MKNKIQAHRLAVYFNIKEQDTLKNAYLLLVSYSVFISLL